MKKLLAILTVMLFAIACNRDQLDYLIEESSNKNELVVLQPRNPSLPKIWSKSPLATRSSGQVYIPADDYLGYSYKIGNTIIGERENVGFRVIDIPALEQTNPTFFHRSLARSNQSGGMAYSSMESYESKDQVTKKVTSGFQVNLVLFKIGRKKTTDETFTNISTSSSNNVFGETWITVRYKNHSFITTSAARRKIATENLDQSFLQAIYNGPIDDVLEKYGPFVVTNYYTGGRASALYYGVTSKETGASLKETGMSNSMNASFAWKKVSGEAGLEFGKGNINYKSSDTFFARNYFTVKTSGGSNALNVSTPSVDMITSPSVDLTNWYKSLDDPDTHTLIDIADAGLAPISDFIIEENFFQRFQDTHMDWIMNPMRNLGEPYIEIKRVYIRSVGSEKLYGVAPVLTTRQGDKLILWDGPPTSATDAELRANSVQSTFMAKANAIAADKGAYYDLLITANFSNPINPLVADPLCFELGKGMKENRMAKCYNPNTHMMYIYDSVSRYALSYYYDDYYDYIPFAYGIYDWVESLPVKNISMTSLSQIYRVIGL